MVHWIDARTSIGLNRYTFRNSSRHGFGSRLILEDWLKGSGDWKDGTKQGYANTGEFSEKWEIPAVGNASLT